jgi:hypothetical protein
MQDGQGHRVNKLGLGKESRPCEMGHARLATRDQKGSTGQGRQG